MSDPRTLIVGIGSSHGDDQVGWLVVQGLSALENQKNHELRVAKSPADVLDWLDGSQRPVGRIVICDASHGTGNLGEIRKWTWPSPEISEVTLSGTHNIALPTVLGLAEKLGRLPADISIWTIEGATDQATGSLSREVSQSIPELVNRIVHDIRHVQPLPVKPCTNSL